MPRLEQWTITDVDGSGPRLFGTAYGHPRIIEGHRVSSSRIVRIDGNTAVTETGTEYTLGTPNPEAVELWKDSPTYLVLKALGVEDPAMLLLGSG